MYTFKPIKFAKSFCKKGKYLFNHNQLKLYFIMKKLFLAVALVAASMSASAITGFTLNTNYPAAKLSGSTYSLSENVTDLNSNITVTPATSDCDLILPTDKLPTFVLNFKISDVSFSASGPTGTSSARTTWKIYPNYVACNSGSGTPTVDIPTSSGDKVSLILGNSTSAGGTAISYSITGADVSTVSVDAQAQKTVVLTATGAISITLANKARVYAVVNGVLAATNDAISSDLLSLNGSNLVNDTNLKLDVYTVTGIKVLSSSESTVSVDALPAGAYVVATEKGTLKFVK